MNCANQLKWLAGNFSSGQYFRTVESTGNPAWVREEPEDVDWKSL